MKRKRVLLVESGRFIGGVIHSLFCTNEHLAVIETAPASALELLEAVRRHKPNIVVMDDTLKEDYLAELLAFMQASEKLRVVVVNTNDNRVELYEKQRITYNQTADFFAIL